VNKPLSAITTLLICCSALAACQSPATVQKVDTGAKLHYELGVDALHKHELPKAFEELMKSDKMRPNQPDTLDALGVAWRMRGDLKKADSYYRRLIHLPGVSSRNYTNYASLLLQMKKYKQAELMARKALQDPRYASQDIAYIVLGDALLGQDRFNEAIKAYRQALQMNPNSIAAVLHEASAYEQYGRYNYARALYETKLRDLPGNRPLTEALLALLKKHNDLDAARELLEGYRDNHSKDPLQKAWAEDELNQLDQLEQ
jgi:type IV pilus assembly protein PilF